MVMSEGAKRSDAKAFNQQKLGRLMTFWGFMTGIVQRLVYGILIASNVVSALLYNWDGIGGGDEEPMSARTSRIELAVGPKQCSPHDTECDIGSSVVCRITLKLAGRNLEDYKQHCTKALMTTKFVIKYLKMAKTHTARFAEKCVDRQTIHSKHDEEPDQDRPTNNMLDPQFRTILVPVLDCLTMWIVYIGVWLGERLPTSFIMGIHGPLGITQYSAGLDSGSSENLISRRTALALGLPIELYEEPDEGPLLHGVGISFRPVGRVTFTWCVSNFDTAWYKTTFAVLEDCHCRGFNILLSREEIDKRRFYIRNRGVFFLQRRWSSP
ncbi:MAG: hypothetical protein LQ346_002859 [Caloplaca aetnensis]|nr:MAG: hypothetical protein LQ346_002859 [Caloplaca aetnensis]